MPQLPVLNIQGNTVGQINLDESVFAAPISEATMHQVVVQYLAAQRQGTHSTLKRGEVRGGGRKPWRQKGTGRARAGSTRSPLWRKGGVTFGPKPRDYRFSIPKKMRQQAMRSALTTKVLEQNVIVLDTIDFAAPKTKDMMNVLANLQIDRKALIITESPEQNVYLSARNIPGISVSFAGVINVYELLLHDKLIITQEAVKKIEEVYTRA